MSIHGAIVFTDLFPDAQQRYRFGEHFLILLTFNFTVNFIPLSWTLLTQLIARIRFRYRLNLVRKRVAAAAILAEAKRKQEQISALESQQMDDLHDSYDDETDQRNTNPIFTSELQRLGSKGTFLPIDHTGQFFKLKILPSSSKFATMVEAQKRPFELKLEKALAKAAQVRELQEASKMMEERRQKKKTSYIHNQHGDLVEKSVKWADQQEQELEREEEDRQAQEIKEEEMKVNQAQGAEDEEHVSNPTAVKAFNEFVQKNQEKRMLDTIE